MDLNFALINIIIRSNVQIAFSSYLKVKLMLGLGNSG